MSDSKLNNLGGASSEHGFFIRSVMANGNGWLLYSLVVTIVCSFHGFLQKKINKTIWFAKLRCCRNLVLRKSNIFPKYFTYSFMEESDLRNCSDQEFRREGWTETAIILCKLNKSL